MKIYIKVIAFLICCGFNFYGCKKINNEGISQHDNSGVEKMKAIVAEKMKEYNGGWPLITTVNQRMPMTFVDMDGNPVSIDKVGEESLVSACLSNIPEACDLKEYVRIYYCRPSSGTGYVIQYEFEVSWNNNIVLVNPFNPANTTKGRVRVTHPLLGITYDQTTAATSITDMGADPDYPGNNIFRVKFKSPESTLVGVELSYPGVVLRLGATFASDCASLDNYGLAPQDPAGWSLNPGDPAPACARNEKIYITVPPSTLSTDVDKFSIASSNIFSSVCNYSVLTEPDLIQVQYQLNGTGSWIPLKMWNPSSPIQVINPTPTNIGTGNSGFLRPNDFAESLSLPSGNHNVVFRYKNWKYNTLPTPITNRPIPTTGTACRTYGNDNANSWAYESFNVTIP